VATDGPKAAVPAMPTVRRGRMLSVRDRPDAKTPTARITLAAHRTGRARCGASRDGGSHDLTQTNEVLGEKAGGLRRNL
jgi:hypothetical protein